MTVPARDIPSVFAEAAARGTADLVFHLEDGAHRTSIADLADRARRRAQRVIELGLQPGDTVGLLGRNRPQWVEWALAVWHAGGVLVPLPLPVRVRAPEVFRAQIAALVAAARCRFVVVEPDRAGAVAVETVIGWDEISAEDAGDARSDPDGLAVIQFTSGSTAAPKGVMLPHRTVLAGVDGLGPKYDPRPGRDATLSWVPFFHDLGLIQYLLMPMLAGIDAHHLPTELFARDPARWLRGFGETGATITAGPSSAWAAALRAARRDPTGIDLTSLQVAKLSAETIDPDIVGALIAFGEQRGLRPEAVGGGYGLAEFTLGVSTAERGAGMPIDRVDVAALAEGRAVPAQRGDTKRVASCGTVFRRVELRIIGPDGTDRGEREVGEIVVRGPSMMAGYVGDGTPSPIIDGWLHTGDLAYMAEGELYFTGRTKDVVVAFGQNYYPEDFERTAGRVPGVRAGRCAAFGLPDEEGRVVVLVEPAEGADVKDLARAVRNAIGDSIAVLATEVAVVEPGTVLKTTSGKLRRDAMRSAYREGTLGALATEGRR